MAAGRRRVRPIKSRRELQANNGGFGLSARMKSSKDAGNFALRLHGFGFDVNPVHSATGVSLNTSVEYDSRFGGVSDDFYYLLMVGLGTAGKGTEWRPGGG
jgi:hypothetical protein